METCLYRGKQICAYDVTNTNYALNYELKKEWVIAGRNGELICQECGKEVQLKIRDPRKKIPHFFHKTTDDKCPFSNNDLRESEEHKKGKMLLYLYFKDRYPEVTPIINYRFPNRRKADLYIEFKNEDKLAVEYQRTELDILEWQERQEEYTKANINVLWLIGGKEEHIRLREKQVEVTFFQQIMLNELDKVAVYLDVSSSKLIFARNMRYSDPYVINNDFEELYIKSYNINDVLIYSNGKTECNFLEEYKKVNEEFVIRYTNKCLKEEQQRQLAKEYESRRKDEMLKCSTIESKIRASKETPITSTIQEEKPTRYFTTYAPYMNKIKYILKDDEKAMEEVTKYLVNRRNSDDFSVITTIFKYNYLKGNMKAKDTYSKFTNLAGFGDIDLEVMEKDANELVCPICKGKLIQRYGKYGAFISCSNYPLCHLTFNIDL